MLEVGPVGVVGDSADEVDPFDDDARNNGADALVRRLLKDLSEPKILPFSSGRFVGLSKFNIDGLYSKRCLPFESFELFEFERDRGSISMVPPLLDEGNGAVDGMVE